MPEPNDHELLAKFVHTGSEAAFAALVERHVNLIYSAAYRFTGNPHHAQEITQAVYVILARKAKKLSPRVVLSGWLYQTARLTAANFMKGEFRRRRREQEAYVQSTLNQQDTWAWEQIEPLLETAMGDLNETDRAAVVLRFFENKTAAEVAAALKLTESGAHKRLSRALEKLRRIFSRRGVALTTTIIAGAISANSVQAAPVGLVATITATTAKGSSVAVSILTLVKGTLNLMAWTKIKTAIFFGIIAFFAAGTATVVVSQSVSPKLETRNEMNQFYIRPGIQNTLSKERFEDLKANAWPRERQLEQDRIKSRQERNETTDAVTINLKAYINTALTDSPPSPIGNNEDNLAELPSGTHIYAGVPFDVQGSIQLMGKGMTRYKKTFPGEVDDILIKRRCKKLHLLHGSNWTYMNAFGTTLAKLVLHYTDGNKQEIAIVAGEHVFDWWFPLFKTGIDPRYFKMAPGTERAWTGSNDFIKKIWPGESLLLYKSTFNNPRPDVEISSIDYVSTMTLSAPFLVGLTLE